MTNLLFIITVITTNWVSNGDWKRESGTNWVSQTQLVVTNIYACEVVTVTNKTLVKRLEGSTTNAPTRWTLSGIPSLPPLPGAFRKE